MELFNKFFNYLFYPFLIGIIITIVSIIVFINTITFKRIDLKTSQNIVSIEKKKTEININTISVLLLNDLVKVQLGLQQQILFYGETINRINNLKMENITLQNYTYNYYELKEMNLTEINLKNKKDDIRNMTDFFSVWFVDENIRNISAINKNKNLYKQLLGYSYITQSIYSFWTSLSDLIFSIHFFFESTNLYITFPYYEDRILDVNIDNPSWCTDENGNLYNSFKFTCYLPYELIKLADDSIFDINNNGQSHRKIYIFNTRRNTNSYFNNHYIMCIKFIDVLTDGNSYICADINNNKLFSTFENFNRLLKGASLFLV